MRLDLLEEVRAWARQANPAWLGNDVLLTNLAIEHLQLEILRSIGVSQLGSFVVFQGGTALRRFYGNGRFSEDLDFAIRPTSLQDPNLRASLPAAIAGFARSLQRHLPARFGLAPEDLQIRSPDDPYAILPAQGHTGVVSWRIRIPLSAAGRSRLVKVDVAAVPAHTVELRAPHSPIASIPRLSSAPFYVPVESKLELLADKLVALACRPYIKGRDIWDLARVFQTTPATPADLFELLGKKAGDYAIGSAVDLGRRLLARSAELTAPEIQTAYASEMRRFAMPEALGDPATLVEDLRICGRLANQVARGLSQRPEEAPGPEGPG